MPAGAPAPPGSPTPLSLAILLLASCDLQHPSSAHSQRGPCFLCHRHIETAHRECPHPPSPTCALPVSAIPLPPPVAVVGLFEPLLKALSPPLTPQARVPPVLCPPPPAKQNSPDVCPLPVLWLTFDPRYKAAFCPHTPLRWPPARSPTPTTTFPGLIPLTISNVG